MSMSRLVARQTFVVVAVVWTLTVAGCGSQNARYPISGKVNIDGKPAARARVFLVPLTGAPQRPSAETLPDGSFNMNGADGAAAGEYAVTVIWPIYTVNGGEEIQTGDQLKGRYGNTDNPAAKVTINAGENVIPPLNLSTR
jgi:hypothetical protein